MSKYGVFSGSYFPVFGPVKTPYLDTFYAVLGEIKANMMAMKSFFMNEIYELKNEISLLLSLIDRNKNTEPGNGDTIKVLERKLAFLEKKNLILRSELENKQKTTDSH